MININFIAIIFLFLTPIIAYLIIIISGKFGYINPDSKYFINYKFNFHKLIGPSYLHKDGDHLFHIDGNLYMIYDKLNNKLILYSPIIKLLQKYEKYINQNITYLTQINNPNIYLRHSFKKDELDKLPNWLKDFIIL